MTQPTQSPVSTAFTRREQATGCASPVAQVFTGVYLLFLIIIAQVIQWSTEQALFEESIHLPDTRWAITLIFSLAVIIPLAFFAFSRTSGSRPNFRTWFWAGVFALLMVPSRLAHLTDAQLAGVLQIAGMLVFLLVFGIWRRSNGIVLSRGSGTTVAMAAGFGLVIMLPFALWGALGSPLDAILNLLTGLLLGLCAAMLFAGSLLVTGSKNDWNPNRARAVGVSAALTLLILATGFGVNSQQWLLAVVLPLLGWLAVALSLAVGSDPAPAWLPPALLVGLAACGPLLFLDPDELNLIAGSGPGEIIGWAIRMSFASAILALIGAIAARVLAGRAVVWKWPRVFPLVMLVVLLAVYFFAGRPGFYGERLFVIMKDQIDVSAAVKMPDYNQRRAFVYHMLVEKANASQAYLRQALSRFGIEHKPYYLVNGMEVWGGPLLRAWLETQPGVDRVLENPELRPLPRQVPIASGSAILPSLPLWNQTMLGADRVWKDLGVTGKGIIVGQSDSGVQGDHPELAGSYRGMSGGKNDNWYDPWNHSSKPVDLGGHGTHTLGSILGKNVGIAPGAQWIACVNLARNLGNPSYYLDCWQFMLAPFPQGGDPLKDGDTARGAMVLNNSWGCPTVEGCDPNTFLPAVRALRNAGIFVVVSAGNSGDFGCGTVEDPPAIYQDVYSVGAVDSQGQRASFSSLGPVTVDSSNRVKPDIAAPGVQVLSAYPNSTYTALSGTSMAGPQVVGTVALMWSANPKLMGDIDRTTQILNQSARPYRGPLAGCATGQGTPNDITGYGIVDAYTAVQMAQAAK